MVICKLNKCNFFTYLGMWISHVLFHGCLTPNLRSGDCLIPSSFHGCSFFRACYGVLRFIMENGAKGCEVCTS